MKYTVRFAHLETIFVQPGQIVSRGQVIGKMGSTGQSTAAHLHIDCVEGEHKERYNLSMMGKGKPKPDKKQLDFFIDSELFETDIEITTGYLDPDYEILFSKPHAGYDVVPKDRKETDIHYKIHWNRSASGEVIKIMKNDPGYGKCVYVVFNA